MDKKEYQHWYYMNKRITNPKNDPNYYLNHSEIMRKYQSDYYLKNKEILQKKARQRYLMFGRPKIQIEEGPKVIIIDKPILIRIGNCF